MYVTYVGYALSMSHRLIRAVSSQAVKQFALLFKVIFAVKVMPMEITLKSNEERKVTKIYSFNLILVLSIGMK